MICYRDMTFCASDCVNAECFRNFTAEHQEKARKWWSHDPDNAPVAYSDFSRHCEEYKK